jgi:hypothetical protein
LRLHVDLLFVSITSTAATATSTVTQVVIVGTVLGLRIAVVELGLSPVRILDLGGLLGQGSVLASVAGPAGLPWLPVVSVVGSAAGPILLGRSAILGTDIGI